MLFACFCSQEGALTSTYPPLQSSVTSRSRFYVAAGSFSLQHNCKPPSVVPFPATSPGWRCAERTPRLVQRGRPSSHSSEPWDGTLSTTRSCTDGDCTTADFSKEMSWSGSSHWALGSPLQCIILLAQGPALGRARPCARAWSKEGTSSSPPCCPHCSSRQQHQQLYLGF